MFELGQKVLCIDTSKTAIDAAPGIVAGEIYTVRSMSTTAHDISNPSHVFEYHCITVEEVMIKEHRGYKVRDRLGYAAYRFRPLDDPSLDIFRKMCVNPDDTKKNLITSIKKILRMNRENRHLKHK